MKISSRDESGKYAPLLILIFDQNYLYRNCYMGRRNVVMQNPLERLIVFILKTSHL
jgi:hypothetical protein